MKKYSIYPLLLLLMISTNSCLFTEDEVFDDPAAQRLNHAIQQAETVLSNASNGWVMEYFPTNETEGYTFLIRFTEDGKAEVGSKNKYTPTYTVDSGCWEVIGDNGPVLTFNTFINNFHLFSDPRLPGQSGYNGVGLGGDYEFIILDVTNELIRLKGKKRGTDIVLRPLPSGQEWENYYTKLEEMDAALFNKVAPVDLTLVVGGKSYFLQGGASHIFTVVEESTSEEEEEEEDEENAQDLKFPFVTTDYGFRLSQSFELNGINIKSFTLGDDKQHLYCLEDNTATITGVKDLANFFVNNKGSVWKIDATTVSSNMKSLLDRITDSCKSLYAANEVSVAIGYLPGRATHSLKLVIVRNNGTQTIQGNLDLSSSRVDRETIAFENSGKGDKNGTTFYTRVDGLKELLELLSASFKIKTSNTINPADMQFDAVDSDLAFYTIQ